jgi:hypothetical protein
MTELLTDIDSIARYRMFLSASVSALLKRRGSSATVEDIETLVLTHETDEHPAECFAAIALTLDAAEDELEALMPVIQDAWNYFPHRALGGRCPAEIMAGLTVTRKARRRRQVGVAHSKRRAAA